MLRSGGPTPVGGVPKLGDKPHPIRKRGFWRAYRRGEMWAVMSYATKKMMDDLCRQMFMPTPFAKILSDKYAPDNQIYIMFPDQQKLDLK